jgi:hypothetical protein
MLAPVDRGGLSRATGLVTAGLWAKFVQRADGARTDLMLGFSFQPPTL